MARLRRRRRSGDSPAQARVRLLKRANALGRAGIALWPSLAPCSCVLVGQSRGDVTCARGRSGSRPLQKQAPPFISSTSPGSMSPSKCVSRASAGAASSSRSASLSIALSLRVLRAGVRVCVRGVWRDKLAARRRKGCVDTLCICYMRAAPVAAARLCSLGGTGRQPARLQSARSRAAFSRRVTALKAVVCATT